MADENFEDQVSSGLLKDVEEIVVQAYLSVQPGATRPDAYRWLRYEDPDPVARLAGGVRRLRRRGAKFDAEAVDKACARASKVGYLN
jgi:hypothetical protein